MMTTTATGTRAAKSEGSIADIFTSLTDEQHNTLPDRFVDLKKELWKDSLVESWREVLEALGPAVEEVAAKGSEVGSRSFGSVLGHLLKGLLLIDHSAG
jgi:acyl carrier protein phosphodiesterase